MEYDASMENASTNLQEVLAPFCINSHMKIGLFSFQRWCRSK